MNTQEKLFRTLSGIAIILGVFLAVLALKEIKSISYVGRDVANMNTISVTGKGEEIAVPDIAVFSFSVTETAKTVAEAQGKATAKSNSALKAVRDGGVADKDIQTTSYSINPHYEYEGAGICTVYGCPSGKSVITGYDVTQSTSVKVRELSKAGALLSAVGALGVQNVNGLSFSVDKIDDVRDAARSKAIDDAQAKAKVLAKQLGVSLDRITSYYDSGVAEPRPMSYAMDSGMMNIKAAVAPEIAVGESKVVSNVTITYSIK